MPTTDGPRNLEDHVTRQCSQHIVEVPSIPVGPFPGLIKASELQVHLGSPSVGPGAEGRQTRGKVSEDSLNSA